MKAVSYTHLDVYKRQPKDRRNVLLNILPTGTLLLQKVPGPFEGVLPVALGNLSAGALRRLDTDLGELIGLLNADETAEETPSAQI